ncbi:hypothetical protein PCASD_09471 [Puccinia coronata f. sp. avenae]|uniref:Uncharacterized protein n=1 Tax=Puccinia coronata f. sp. avenae TaxID=200324 RepID=A0A2N5UK81_9BASI|nr:hypothetical protein PCASD_09471 [Puccinia coronata f. sp. avenae]
MVRLTRLKISSKIKPNSDGAKMKELEKQIIHRESVMINFFGSRDALKIELEKIQQMDSYKHFMEVLISPTINYHYQFQFLEPRGDFQLSKAKGVKNRLRSILGNIGNDKQQNLKKIKEQGEIALGDIRKGIKSVAKLKEEEKYILRLLTQEGYGKS